MLDVKKFLSEIQMLKRLERSGFKLTGVKNTDTLAEHSLISAQIAFILAEMEGADPFRSAAISLFHDNHEARIGDHNKVSARYLNTKEAEKTAEEEQLANLPEKTSALVLGLLAEKHDRSTKEGIVSQDADWLEVAIQAKILLEQGYIGAEDWINNVKEALETKSAKLLLDEIIEEKDFTNCWWRGLKKMTYKKLSNMDN